MQDSVSHHRALKIRIRDSARICESTNPKIRQKHNIIKFDKMINQPFPQCPSEEWITFIKETNPKILIHRIYLGEVHFKILITLGKREALKPKEPHVKSLTELSKYKNLPGVQARFTFFLWRLRKMAKYHTKNKAPRFFSFFQGVEVKMRRWLPQAFFAIRVRRLFCYFSRWENSFEVGGKSFNFFGEGISLTIREKTL